MYRLFDASRAEAVISIFVERGYDVVSFGKFHHDTYIKRPMFNFEMHREMVAEDDFLGNKGYYDNIKDKLIKDSDSNYGYHMMDEDYFIHMIAHMYEHYTAGCHRVTFI